MDLYQEELTRWLELKAMTSEERQQWWIRKYEAHTCSDVALSAEEFRQYVNITTSVLLKRERDLGPDHFHILDFNFFNFILYS